MTTDEREQKWQLLALRMQAGDIPKRDDVRAHIAAHGDAPEWFEYDDTLQAVLRGDVKSNLRRPKHDIGRLMAQTLFTYEVKAATASEPRGSKQARRDAMLKERGVHIKLFEKWASPKLRDPQCWTRVALHASYHIVGSEAFARRTRELNPHARL